MAIKVQAIRMRVAGACPKCQGAVEVRKYRKKERMVMECTLCRLVVGVKKRQFMEYLEQPWEE